MSTLGSLVVSLEANMAQFTSDMGRAAYVAEQSMKKVSGYVDIAKKSIIALGGAVSLLALEQKLKGAIDSADQLGKLSEKVGISVESLSGLKYSAELADVSLESLAKGVQKMEKAMLATAQGAGNVVAALDGIGVSAKGGAAAAFTDLGIKVTDSQNKLKDAQSVMLAVSDKFAGMSDGAHKTALAMAIFGKSGADLIPLLNKGSEALREQRREAEDFGLVMSKDLTDAAQELNDNLKRLHARSEALWIHLAGELTPAFVGVTDAILEAYKESGKLKAAWVALGGLGAFLFTDEFDSAQVKIKKLVEETNNLAIRLDGLNRNKSGIGFVDRWFWGEAGDMKAKMTANLAEIARLKESLLPKTPATPGAKKDDPIVTAKNKSPGEGFIEQLQKQIALVGLGEYAALREEARLKKVSAAAAPWILNLQKAKEAQADLIAQQDARSASIDNLISQMNKKDFEDPGKVYDYIKAQRDLNNEFDFQTSLIGKTAAAQQILIAARKVDLEVIALSRQLGAQATADLVAQAESVKAAAEKSANARLAAERSWETGAKTAMNNYIDSATNAAKQTETLFNSAFKSMEDGWVSFVKNGKVDFKSLADSIISDLIRIQAKNAIASVIGSANAHAGDFSWVGAILSAVGFGGGKAVGGPVSSGTTYLVGEKGPELFTPSGSGRIIPNSALAGGAGGGDVAINIYVSDSGQSSSGKQGNAAELGRRIAGMVKGVIIDEKRPGGLLAG
jgi:lambda family phage tail tape measure protein